MITDTVSLIKKMIDKDNTIEYKVVFYCEGILKTKKDKEEFRIPLPEMTVLKNMFKGRIINKD